MHHSSSSSSSSSSRLWSARLMALAAAATTTPAAMAITRQCSASSSRPRAAVARPCRAVATASGGAVAAVAREAPVARRTVVERKSTVAAMWRQVQGCDDWEGMLDGELLRGEVARYGELVDACYKAFDLDPSSRRYLNCKYGKERMLEEVGLPASGYVITRYIYAAADVAVPVPSSNGGRWIGYVAVSDDEMTRRLGRRDVLVSFRGTVTLAEWMANLMSSLEPARLDPCDPRPDVKVESGFLSLYTSADKTCRFGGAGSCREQLLREVSRLVTSSGDDDVSVTLAGHSMGAALALLFAYDLAELGLNRAAATGVAAPVTVVSFGGPRVGNAAFKARCDELGVKALRVTNVRDPVTRLPGVFLNEATASVGVLRPWRGACYTHVGVELPLDSFKVGDLASVHDLSTYISLLRDKKKHQHAAAAARDDAGGVMAKVMDFVGRRRGGGGALPWHDAAMLQMGGLVQTLGLI